MKFDGQYIYPPRPKTAVPYGVAVDTFRNPRWVAQAKLNGQRNLIYISPDGGIILWNRHHEHHLNYKLPEWLAAQILQHVKRTPGHCVVLDSELLHAKDSSIKNTICIYDVLVKDGEYLLGSTYDQRYQMLMEMTDAASYTPNDVAHKLTDNLWVSRNYYAHEWDERWKLTAVSWIEGFVFKKIDVRLQPGFSEDNNSSWMIRCRKPTNVSRF